MKLSSQLTDEDLVRMYRWMVLTRAFEDRICSMWGKSGAIECPHGSQGQEAIAVGATYGLRREDQVLPSLRARGMFLVKGISTRVQMAGVFAKATGAARGKATAHHMGDSSVGVISGSAIVGGSITVATGVALALKMQKMDHVVIDTFGDGASQRGDFHEALNFAGVLKLPVIFILENNGFSEYTPLAKHYAGTDFACRAQGYGFPGIQVDGMDVLAVYEAVQQAVARARSGAGPTLLECVTYRFRNHCEPEPPEAFRDADEIERWRLKDPIPRLRNQLLQRGALTPERIEAIDREIAAEIDESIEFAEASPFPQPDELFRDVYAPEDPALVMGRRA